MAMRLEGILASDIEWERLAVRRRFAPTMAPEKPPPPGDRLRKLELTGCELLAREERLLIFWTKQLQSELCASDAPVLQKLEDSLDPARALEMLAGKTRAGTLKSFVVVYQRWRLWLQEAKLLHPPGRPIDLVDYLLTRRDEPCGRSVPEAIVKAVAWFEKVAEFRNDTRAMESRIVWATKDKIVEALSEGAPLTQRAPRYPTWILVKIERLVLDDGEVAWLRIFAWAKLFKSWASLRWSDIQAIKLRGCPLDLSWIQSAKRECWLQERLSLAEAEARYGRPRPQDGKLWRCWGLQQFWLELVSLLQCKVTGPSTRRDRYCRLLWRYWGSRTPKRISLGDGSSRVRILMSAPNRYLLLDEREIEANLLDWLQDRRKLGEEASKAMEDGEDTCGSGSSSARYCRSPSGREGRRQRG